MLRILLLLLALISAVLAVILEMPWVLGLAGALVLALIVVWIVGARKKNKKRQAKPEAPAGGAAPERELAALGISDIRPKGVTKTSRSESQSVVPAESTPDRPTKPERPAEEKAQAPPAKPADGVRPATVQRLSTRRRQGNFSTTDDDRFAQIIGPYLQSVRASTGAQTIVLLKHDDIEPHYSIEAIVSQNSYARSSGHYHTKQPYIASTTHERVIIRNANGDDAFDSSMLGYYREPIAVRQIAVVPVPASSASTSYLFVADTMNDGELSEPYRQSLLMQFAELLRSILDMLELEQNLESTETPRPRRDIIQEEMDLAKEADESLMFALVYLNQAEDIASGGRLAVAAAEKALEAALHAGSGDRVEKFGELMFGVFRRSTEDSVEDWARDLQQQVASGRGALKGGATIGIVVRGDRHESPESLREDATRALSEAYESHAGAIILE
jgi:hypothetical protein